METYYCDFHVKVETTEHEKQVNITVGNNPIGNYPKDSNHVVVMFTGAIMAILAEVTQRCLRGIVSHIEGTENGFEVKFNTIFTPDNGDSFKPDDVDCSLKLKLVEETPVGHFYSNMLQMGLTDKEEYDHKLATLSDKQGTDDEN